MRRARPSYLRQGIGGAICDRATAEGAALVVLGSHTRAGLQEFLLGCVRARTHWSAGGGCHKTTRAFKTPIGCMWAGTLVR